MDLHSPTHVNFRLPTTVRPVRYDAVLNVDLEGKRFFGEGTIDLEVSRPSEELILHANGLALLSAKLEDRGGTRALVSAKSHPVSETLTLRFDAPVAKGSAKLTLEWAAKFSPGLQGLYSTGKVAVTQFEAADARRVFPCFDEPGFKARWKLAVVVPREATALSNGAIESETVEGDTKRVSFQETELLSSYLIALVMGEVAGSEITTLGSVPVRTWSTPDKVHLTRFGQDVACNTLPLLQEYFGLPYAYGKVDQVGVPGFEAGAMENAGLITYRETALLVDPATAALASQRRVAETITHELAHQWYGNLVTMEWWNDLWLNEAFATWMAVKINDQWKPEWRTWLAFDVGREEALKLDALRSTHPIRAEVRNPAEASESFDVITYEKGAAILRMIEAYLGEAPFRAGIRAYMREHQEKNTVADDLWRALEKASKQPVDELADAWIGRGGYPLVSVSFKGNRVSLSQSRFYSEPGAKSGELWPIPIVLRYGGEGGVKSQRVILRKATQVVTLDEAPTWVCGNADGTGFYRVAYEESAFAALVGAVTELSPAERTSLVTDLWALVLAHRADVRDFLTLAGTLAGDEDHAVLDQLVGALGHLEHDLTPDEARPALRQKIAALFEPFVPTVGWDPVAGEGDLARLRRAAVLRAAGGVGRSPSLLAEARERLERYLEGEQSALAADVHPSAVTMAARGGDQALFERLKRASEEEPDPTLRRRYLFALAAFEAPAQADAAMALAFDWKVPPQDHGFYTRMLFANEGAREATWVRLQKEWKIFQKKTAGPAILRGLIWGLAQLPTPKNLKEVEALIGKSPPAEAKQVCSQVLEEMRQHKALRAKLGPQLKAWLKG